MDAHRPYLLQSAHYLPVSLLRCLKSSIDSRLVEETVLNAEGTEESTTYELDGVEISEKDGEKRVKALGEEITYKPKWRQLADF